MKIKTGLMTLDGTTEHVDLVSGNIQTSFVPGWAVGILLLGLAVCAIAWVLDMSKPEPEAEPQFTVQLTVCRIDERGSTELVSKYAPTTVSGCDAANALRTRLYCDNKWGNHHTFPVVEVRRVGEESEDE